MEMKMAEGFVGNDLLTHEEAVECFKNLQYQDNTTNAPTSTKGAPNSTTFVIIGITLPLCFIIFTTVIVIAIKKYRNSKQARTEKNTNVSIDINEVTYEMNS